MFSIIFSYRTLLRYQRYFQLAFIFDVLLILYSKIEKLQN